MARKSLIVKAKREPKFSTRQYNRCFNCGRADGYMRKFGLSMVTFREWHTLKKIVIRFVVG